MTITDPIEKIVAEALDRAGIEYLHESQGPLFADFYLLGRDTFIECKQFFTSRVTRQSRNCDDIILIQGRKAAETFAKLIGGES